MSQLQLSARAYHRILKLARTIADLAGAGGDPACPPRRSIAVPPAEPDRGMNRYNRVVWTHPEFDIPEEKIADFCRRHHIQKLSLFGSVLSDDFNPDSDVDVLVEFEPGHVPGLGLIRIQDELSALLGGRQVDLVTPKFIEPAYPKAD